MKARIKKTGEIVNLASYATITLEQHDSWGNPIDVKPEEIELIQELTEDEHWQDVRERAVIAAMQGVMNFFGSIDYNKETIAKLAIEQADALIKELRKEK
jgi:hypothetical protein